MKTVLLVLVSAALVVSGCASTTSLSVDKPQVSIYADGRYIGIGSGTYSDSKVAGSSTDIRLEQEGCETVHQTISRDSGVHIGALIGGFFFLVPFLWITKYSPGYRFNYVCAPLVKN